MGRIIGYTQGTFDLFHVGHLRLLMKAKEHCDWLIVGVNSDELVEEYKHKKPVIPAEERYEILQALRCVDQVVITTTLDKVTMYNLLKFQRIFIGDDWRGNERWIRTGKEMKDLGVELVYLPYTKGISSSIIKEKMNGK
jgi:glycerol-3-phosphate cytidylyltransferase